MKPPCRTSSGAGSVSIRAAVSTSVPRASVTATRWTTPFHGSTTRDANTARATALPSARTRSGRLTASQSGSPRKRRASDQRRREHRPVRYAADHVVHLVVPRLTGEARPDEQYVIAPEHARSNGRRARHDDKPRSGCPRRERPAKRDPEPDRAHAQHHETGHHDLRIPGIVGGQAAQLHLSGGVTDLAQRADHPRRGEQHRAHHAAPRAQPAEPHPPHMTPIPAWAQHAAGMDGSVRHGCPRARSVREQVAEIGGWLGQEAAPGADEMEFLPPGGAHAPVAQFHDARAGDGGNDG